MIYHVLLKLNIYVNLKFQKTKTYATVVINLFFQKALLFKRVFQLLQSI